MKLECLRETPRRLFVAIYVSEAKRAAHSAMGDINFEKKEWIGPAHIMKGRKPRLQRGTWKKIKTSLHINAH